jgi:hypothetical protein
MMMLHPQRPHPSRRRTGTIIAALVALAGGATAMVPLFQPPAAQALESDMRAARTKYPGIVGSPINHCSLCHVSDSNFHLDPYGRAFNVARRDFAAIESADSDGDGFTNLAEITARTFPGKADSFPTATVTATQTVTPTVTLTPVPTDVPTHVPTQLPTHVPTVVPTHIAPPTATDVPVERFYVYLPKAEG